MANPDKYQFDAYQAPYRMIQAAQTIREGDRRIDILPGGADFGHLITRPNEAKTRYLNTIREISDNFKVPVADLRVIQRAVVPHLLAIHIHRYQDTRVPIASELKNLTQLTLDLKKLSFEELSLMIDGQMPLDIIRERYQLQPGERSPLLPPISPAKRPDTSHLFEYVGNNNLPLLEVPQPEIALPTSRETALNWADLTTLKGEGTRLNTKPRKLAPFQREIFVATLVLPKDQLNAEKIVTVAFREQISSLRKGIVADFIGLRTDSVGNLWFKLREVGIFPSEEIRTATLEWAKDLIPHKN